MKAPGSSTVSVDGISFSGPAFQTAAKTCQFAGALGPSTGISAAQQEAFIAKDTFGSGSVWDIGFSVDPEQTFLIVPDGTNQQVYVLERKTLRVVSTFGGAGHWAGQFYGAHNLAVNARGDLFITETYEGKRVQKFRYMGLGPANTGQ